MSEIPEHLVKKLLKERIRGNVSHESVVFVRDYLQSILDMLADNSIVELEELNRLRQIQKLPKLKRYPVSIFINLSDELFNQPLDFKLGEVGQNNIDTTFSTEAEEVF